jgi:hypothetical protein
MRSSALALQVTPWLGSTLGGAKTTLSSAARVAADRVVSRSSAWKSLRRPSSRPSVTPAASA